MDSKTPPNVETRHKVFFSITSALVSAVHEWLLILMLFIDACFSYLLTKFAHRCHLQIPCLICSRLDHVLGKERSSFYWDLICQKHKLNISSLVKSIDSQVAEFDSSIDHIQSSKAHPLPHVEYKKINVTSDTESEAPLSDNGSASALIREIEIPKFCTVEVEAPFLLHGVEEKFNLQHKDPAFLSSDFDGSHYEESKETIVTSTGNLGKKVNIGYGEASKLGRDSILANEIHMDSKPSIIETSSQMADSFDLGDAYKLALGTSGRQLSGRLLEHQRSMTNSRKASEDLKLLLSQISINRGIELSLNDSSPTEDYKSMEALGSILQRRISLERNESSLSIDGSTVSEIEGESEVERLKRQVEHDKKIMCALYKELEEERNASSIAANQTMAMITRLQEEKASLHMEALQCLRMMEEQAEYDAEALQKANDTLLEKEKIIRDFEVRFEKELQI
ncbi:hypothetical protein ACJIZ3_018660 [Penstemon smallii]|uniref:GTD-binding domain-containing protein n=1 Tax=Penstemon smallii TaxID=265156 RepID=A0ABD3T069_9LAMI